MTQFYYLFKNTFIHVPGAIFYDDAEYLGDALNVSADISGVFDGVVQYIPRGQIIEAGEKVCELAKVNSKRDIFYFILINILVFKGITNYSKTS